MVLNEDAPRRISVLNGILWVLRTGAPWHDLPERYTPYQTCHRRFQRWIEERGGLDLSECFIDGTFVGAKKGEDAWESTSGDKVRRSWRWQTALVFLSSCTRRALARMSHACRGDARGELPQ